MLKSLVTVARLLFSAAVFELAGAALIVAGVARQFGSGWALVVAGVLCLAKAFDLALEKAK